AASIARAKASWSSREREREVVDPKSIRSCVTWRRQIDRASPFLNLLSLSARRSLSTLAPGAVEVVARGTS
ncbi:Os02g0303000, partial [Oryza sativa Japonica Group]